MRNFEIRELAEEDLAGVAGLIRSHHPDSSERPTSIEERLRWFVFANPARQPDIPLGWTLSSVDGSIGGVMLCVPQYFQHQGRRFPMLMSGSFYVNEEFRGAGFAIFQRYRKLGSRHPLYCTTANEMSGSLWKRFGGRPMTATDRECIGVLRWPPLVEEVVQRRLSMAPLASLAGGLASLLPGPRSPGTRLKRVGGGLQRVTDAADAADLDVTGREAHADLITAVRDEAFLRWRYFEGPGASRALFRFEAGDARCLVGACIQKRGHRGQIRTLTVLDVWGLLPGASIGALAGCLAEAYRGQVDMLVFRGQHADREAVLLGSGFRHRALPLPIGWFIDPERLLPEASWYVVPADGDMGL